MTAPKAEPHGGPTVRGTWTSSVTNDQASTDEVLGGMRVKLEPAGRPGGRKAGAENSTNRIE